MTPHHTNSWTSPITGRRWNRDEPTAIFDDARDCWKSSDGHKILYIEERPPYLNHWSLYEPGFGLRASTANIGLGEPLEALAWADAIAGPLPGDVSPSGWPEGEEGMRGDEGP